MTPQKIADEMESFARDGVRPDEGLLRDWAKHLRASQSEAVERDAAQSAMSQCEECGAMRSNPPRHWTPRT